ncbi:myb-binding protein 1A-like protein [Amyelois transitella]|uniref:myb-binding protein 1A-like protein n=1 Tax=Amyelois transitella TaxID=680683 RepID=UPI0029901F97|nr:myb-binding protein 1A-like protein [Amyelois transitella]
MQIKMDDESEGIPKTETKVTPSVLDAFDLLRASKDDDKLSGGVKIIFQLQKSENEKDINYALKRLVRSLGANVPDMRTGYFAALVTLLKKHSQITVSTLLDLIKKELHASKSSKSEVGDVALGQILVCGAIFRSGLMIQCTDEEQKAVMELLLNASKKKSYLSTVTYLVLLDFITELDEEQFSSIVWSNIKAEFKKDLKEHSLDSLYFLLVANSKFSSKVKLRKLIGVTEILCEDNIHVICEKLMMGIDFNSVRHPVYKEIGTQIANSPHLKLFWTSGIDSQLSKHNRNRELAAMNLLSTILENIHENHEVIPELISTNIFKLLMDWFKGLKTASKIRNKRDDEDDHKIMIKKGKELLNLLAKVLKSEQVTNSIRVETLIKLLFNPGEMNFGEVTGTSVIKSIISDLDKDGVKKMAKLFKGVLLNTSKKFVKEDVERNWYNNERVKAAELLSFLVSHEAVKDDTEFKLTYMKLLMCFGFFKIGGDVNVAISIDLSASIKSCFYRCFSSRFSNVDGLVTVLSSLCNFVCSILEKEEVRKKLEKQFPAESMECWQMLTHICQDIEQNDSKSKVDKVFLILLYQLGLFLFSEPTHVKVSRSSIKELKSCYEHYRKGRKKKPGKIDSEEPEWIEVLIEVLLSILSVESSVLRSVVQCVFRLIWEFLTPTAIGQIISVLDPESESNPLTENDDSEDDSDNDDDDGEADKEDSSDKNDDDSDGINSEADEEEDEEMKIPDQLRMAVQKALGTAVPESDTESVDADMIDEEEGKKLDEALAEAFKQFQSGKAKGKKNKKERKDKKALSDFRIRVLDLIDIYLEKDPAMDICLNMMAPLMRCLEFCMRDNQFSELENRVRKTIKTLTKIRKFASSEGVTLDVLCDYLKSTIDKGERSHFIFQAVGDVVTYFTIFIIHCSQKLEVKAPVSPKKKKNVSPLVVILKDALQSYFKNRNCLLPIIFFHNVLQTEWEGSYELVPIIIENVFNSEVRQFRRNEGLELLAGFYRALKRNKPDDKTATKLSNLETIFENTLVRTLKDGTDFEAKNNYFVLLRKLVNVIRMFHENCHLETHLDFKSLLDIVGSCKGTNKIKGKPESSGVQTENVKTQKTKKNKKKRKREMNGHAESNPKKLRKDSNQSE